MHSMLKNINKVDGKFEYLIVPKGTKFRGSGKLGLTRIQAPILRTETATQLDPYLVRCTAITERLKFYVRLVMRVDPHTLQGKSLSVPPRLGELLCHRHCSDHSSINPR